MARRTVLLLLALWLGACSIAHAQSPVQFSCRDDFAGVIDGDVRPVPPSNVKIDTNCTIRNYPGGMSTNFTFDNNDPTPYLVIFDNVVHTGNMSCNAVAEPQDLVHQRLVDDDSGGLSELSDPGREDRQAEPAGQTTPPIGVPFTYRSRSRCCSTRPRARSSTTRARSTICTAITSSTISTRRASTSRYVSHTDRTGKTAARPCRTRSRTSAAC